MTTGLTSNIVVNRAVNLIGDNQPPVTGSWPTFDSSPAGVAAAALYSGVVQTVARQFGWDFSRRSAALVATGNAAPFPWSQEYTYPADGIQIRQVMPAALADPNDPLPVDWVVGNTLVSGNPTKVIWTNLANAQVLYTNLPPESTWDSLFTETVVRLLASEMGMAIAARPETARSSLEAAGSFGQVGQTRDS